MIKNYSSSNNTKANSSAKTEPSKQTIENILQYALSYDFKESKKIKNYDFFKN